MPVIFDSADVQIAPPCGGEYMIVSERIETFKNQFAVNGAVRRPGPSTYEVFSRSVETGDPDQSGGDSAEVVWETGNAIGNRVFWALNEVEVGVLETSLDADCESAGNGGINTPANECRKGSSSPGAAFAPQLRLIPPSPTSAFRNRPSLWTYRSFLAGHDEISMLSGTQIVSRIVRDVD